jgi:ABC-type nitrate/sulfonate/bicarbonate transport system substrate-binding protein
MRFSNRRGISRVMMAVVAIVIIIVAVVGGYYALRGGFGTSSSTTTTTPVTSSTTSSGGSSTTSSSTGTNSTPISTATFSIAFQAPSGGESGLAVLVAQQEGYLKQADPNIQLVPIASPAAILQSLIAGTSQVIAGPGTNFIGAYAGGTRNITIVSSTLNELPFALIVSSSSSITSIGQLQNATFASQAPTGATSILLHQIAAEQGWSTLNTVTLQSATATITAVIAGKATATLVDYGTLSTFIGTGLIKVVANITNVLIPNTVVATTSSFLQAHPDAVKAAIWAINHGGAAFNANHTFALNFIVGQIPSIPTLGAKSLVAVLNFSTDGSFSLSALQNTVNTLYKYHAITTNFTASSMVTKGYATVNP